MLCFDIFLMKFPIFIRHINTCWLEVISARGVRSWNPEISYGLKIVDEDSPDEDSN